MAGLLAVLAVLGIILEVPCDATAINATYEQEEIYLDFFMNVFARTTPGLDYLGRLPTHAATSCQQIANLKPNSTSGLYWIQVSSSPSRVYCDMNMTECGGGVWTRIAHINMTVPSTMCPSGLERVTSPKRSCRKTVDTGSSSSTFSTFGLPYNNVCGYVMGYQFGTPDAFNPYQNEHTVDSCYADGVLLSYNHPREHIWTFAAGVDGYHNKNRKYGCPCRSITHPHYDGTVPRFVNEDYFCETAVHNDHATLVHYIQNPLWDGKGCGTFPNGCEGTRDPWFQKTFPYTINSDVEVRVCLDQGRVDEDILIEQIHIYVQ